MRFAVYAFGFLFCFEFVFFVFEFGEFGFDFGIDKVCYIFVVVNFGNDVVFLIVVF